MASTPPDRRCVFNSDVAQWQDCCIHAGMVVVVFSAGRRLILFDGKSARRLNPGVEVYNATGKLLFYSHLEVLSVTLNGQAITTSHSAAIIQELTRDDPHA